MNADQPAPRSPSREGPTSSFSVTTTDPETASLLESPCPPRERTGEEWGTYEDRRAGSAATSSSDRSDVSGTQSPPAAGTPCRGFPWWPRVRARVPLAQG